MDAARADHRPEGSRPPDLPLVDRLPDSLLVSMGEDEALIDEVAAGRHPNGEFYVLRSIFEQTASMRRFRPDKLGSTGWQIRFAWEALRRARSMPRLQLVYLTEEIPGIFVLLALRLLGRNVKRLMLIHNVTSQRRTLPFRLFGLARDLDHVFCLSQSSKEYLRDRYGIPEKRSTVLLTRVDTDFFARRPVPAPGGRPIVASAGAVNRDYETLIEACEGLDVDLKIAADTAWRYSTDEALLARTAEAARNNPRVEMRSWGNYVNLRELYARSSIVVVPLKDVPYASGQTVILEAMSMGRPVITSDIRGRSDFIEHGVTGIYVKPEDPAALRVAIDDLLRDPEKAAAIGSRAAEAVRARHTVTDYVNSILRPCLALLGEPR